LLKRGLRDNHAESIAHSSQRTETAAVASAVTDEVALRRHVERVVSEWRERLAQDVSVARRPLRTLLAGGAVAAKPVERADGERVYAVEGGALLSGPTLSK